MLTKKENAVMNIIYHECSGKQSSLISPLDIKQLLKEGEFTIENIENIVSDLFVDGYFDLIYSERRGERMYCITLTEKGKGYERNKKVTRRNLIYRISLTVVLAVFSFVIGLILKAIF